MTVRMTMCITAACVVTACAALHCMADEWGPPEPEHWSANRQFVLKVTWPGNKLALFRADAQATPEERLWSRPYVDDTWPPHAAYVTSDGRHVVLRDVYHNLGYGKVLVFLGQNGQVIRSYELSDLLTQKQVLETRQTVSSTWWSEPGWFSFLREDTLFAVVTPHGIIQCFNVADGNRLDLDQKTREEIRALAARTVSNMLKDQNANRREAGATLAAALNVKEFVPDLMALLRDRTVTCQRGSSERMYDYYGVQVEAVRALAILGQTNIVSLIEPLLSNSTHVVRDDLLDVVAGLDGGLYDVRKTPDSDYLLTIWHRLTNHSEEDVRRYATKAVVVREDIDYILDHPALLDDPEEMMRYHSVRSLVDRGDKRGIALLRKALHDAYGPTGTWAFRGLLKYQPPDIEAILRDGMMSKDRSIQIEAMTELIRRGDKTAVETLGKRLAKLEQHTHNREGWGTEEMEAQEMCELVAELRIREVRPELRRAHLNECEQIRRPVAGALAALGDKDALSNLREFAARGDSLDRAASIRMLALVGDSESLPSLTKALEDSEPWVREAAQKAIERMQQGNPTSIESYKKDPRGRGSF